MRSPIIAVERGGEIHMFSTVEEAESYIEPNDVRACEYDLYDASGKILSASVQRKDQGPFAPERVSLSNTENDGTEKLVDQIRSYLLRVGVTMDAAMALPKILEQLSKYARSSCS